MASSKIAPGESKLEVLLDRHKWNKLAWFEIHFYRAKSGVVGKEGEEWVTRKQKEQEIYRRQQHGSGVKQEQKSHQNWKKLKARFLL